MRAGILEREAELSVLAAAVQDATAGNGSVVLISGEAASASRASSRRSGRSCLPRAGCSSATATTWPRLGEHPYALQAAGRWREAATAWAAADCPYERAAALAESPDPADLLTALGILDDLGARPLATRVRGRLRALGVYYSFSTFLCVPNALSQEGGYSLGAQAGEEPLERLAPDAGFARFRRVAETPFNIVHGSTPVSTRRSWAPWAAGGGDGLPRCARQRDGSASGPSGSGMALHPVRSAA